MRKIEVTKEWGITFQIGQWGENICSLNIGFIYGAVFIPLWFRFKRTYDPSYCLCPSYGFSWKWSGYRGDLFLHWFDKTKIIYMPWAWEHVRHDVLMKDQTWRRVAKKTWIEGDEANDDGRPWEWKDKFQEEHSYKYKLKNGTIQERIATIGVEEREWRWRWFTWLPFPRKISRCLEVRFNDEVGERSGSWKGGCIGCGYEMKKREAPFDCLKRMERERIFS